MDEEDQGAARRRRSRMRLIVVMVVLVLVGVALWAMPVFLYPDNIVHSDVLNEGNDHTTEALLTLDEGTYEVWMTTSIWSWMSLDTPRVYVNDTYGGSVYVDDIYGGDDRTIEGDDCRHFATFEIDETGTYNLSVTAGYMDLGIPGNEQVYIVEERPSVYSALQLSGISVIGAGLLGATILMILMALETSERKKRENPPTQPPAPYPPPAYPPYPPQQQPYYGQYPPPQQPPPYPPPQQGPPQQQRPPPY